MGEIRVRSLGETYLDQDIYHSFHNVTIQTHDGTTQIDHIIISIFGIFVIETKNMSGWIFGNENDQQWTQIHYKQKQRFQNPLRQNYKHLKEIENTLQVGERNIFSVVAFVGDAEFKTPMPANVTRHSGFARYIQSKRTQVFSKDEVATIICKISSTRLPDTRKTAQLHINNVTRKFEKETVQSQDDNTPWIGIAGSIFAIIVLLSLPMNCQNKQAVVQYNLPQQQADQTDPHPQTALPESSHQHVPKVPHTQKSKTHAPQIQTLTPRSPEYGILTITAAKDTYLSFYHIDTNTMETRLEVKKGQTKNIEIKKGIYTAEILQSGGRKTTTVSFISNTGNLDLQ